MLKFRITALISPAAGGELIKGTSELVCLNHHDAIRHALNALRAEGIEHPEALPDEADGMSIIVEATEDQEEGDGIWWPSPHISQESDLRDPTGKILRRMVWERCEREAPILPGKHHEREEAYRLAHPEFGMEYLLELQRLEREQCQRHLDGVPEPE